MLVKDFTDMNENVQNFLVENLDDLGDVPTYYSCEIGRAGYKKIYHYNFSITDDTYILVEKETQDIDGGKNSSNYFLKINTIPQSAVAA